MGRLAVTSTSQEGQSLGPAVGKRTQSTPAGMPASGDPAQREEESLIAKPALCARIAREAPAEAPATPGNLIAGAKLYREFCAVCRGTSGAPPTPDYPPPVSAHYRLLR